MLTRSFDRIVKYDCNIISTIIISYPISYYLISYLDHPVMVNASRQIKFKLSEN